MPASSTAVSVSFFYDSSRSLYRIISVEGQKAVINSTVTPNMTFTKTSQKFGQWSDTRANTVYGLGFSSEAELQKVSYLVNGEIMLMHLGNYLHLLFWSSSFCWLKYVFFKFIILVGVRNGEIFSILIQICLLILFVDYLAFLCIKYCCLLIC